ncbi:MAG: hypothetical protein COA75_02180 [Cellvibrionales bacterium]|nr:MAG: hypothetical protein COA75_02180 [Cellvibrionales bacterium]
MELSQVITQRRTVKQFDPAHQLSAKEFETLISQAVLAPTSFNLQHWRFVRISDPALRADICSAAWDQVQVVQASELLVITADIKAWEKNPKRYWQNADTETQTMVVAMLTEFYQGREGIQRDEAIRSAAFAAQNLMLSAKDMGYDSCPMIGFDAEAVGALIKLPADHLIVMLLAIGKAAAEPAPRAGQLSLGEVLIDNRFAE